MSNQFPAYPYDDPEVRETMKQRINDRLVVKCLDQFTAAKLCGKGSHYIYDFMVGKKLRFPRDGIYRIAVVLDCSIEYLLGRSDDPGSAPPPRRSFDEIMSEAKQEEGK